MPKTKENIPTDQGFIKLIKLKHKKPVSRSWT